MQSAGTNIRGAARATKRRWELIIVDSPSYKSVYVSVLVVCFGGLVVLYSFRLLGVGFAQGPLQPIVLTALGAAAFTLAFGLILTWMMRGMSRSMDEEGALFPDESPLDLPEAGKVNIAERRRARKNEIIFEIRSAGRLAQRASDSVPRVMRAVALSSVSRLRWWRLRRRLSKRQQLRKKEVREARFRLNPGTSLSRRDAELSEYSERQLEVAESSTQLVARQPIVAPPTQDDVKLIAYQEEYAEGPKLPIDILQPLREVAEEAGLPVFYTRVDFSSYPIVIVMGDVEEVAAVLLDLYRKGLNGFTIEAENEDDVVFFQYIFLAEFSSLPRIGL